MPGDDDHHRVARRVEAREQRRERAVVRSEGERPQQVQPQQAADAHEGGGRVERQLHAAGAVADAPPQAEHAGQGGRDRPDVGRVGERREGCCAGAHALGHVPGVARAEEQPGGADQGPGAPVARRERGAAGGAQREQGHPGMDGQVGERFEDAEVGGEGPEDAVDDGDVGREQGQQEGSCIPPPGLGHVRILLPGPAREGEDLLLDPREGRGHQAVHVERGLGRRHLVCLRRGGRAPRHEELAAVLVGQGADLEGADAPGLRRDLLLVHAHQRPQHGPARRPASMTAMLSSVCEATWPRLSPVTSALAPCAAASASAMRTMKRR